MSRGPAVKDPRAYNPNRSGCTYDGCNRQDTETVDGIHGRRCANHPPAATRRSRSPWKTPPTGGTK